jgi:cytochrome c
VTQKNARRQEMKKTLFNVAVLGMVVLMAVCAAGVAGAATEEDAKALALKAVAYWQANGMEKAVAEYNNQKGPFVKGDLYVVALDFKGNVLAHGGNPVLTGMNLVAQKDKTTGKLFVKEQIEIAKAPGSGWTSYTWPNPVTKKVQAKKSWVQRAGNEEWYVVCGIFIN